MNLKAGRKIEVKKMKKVELEFTQRMADDLNKIQDEIFTKEDQKILGIERYKPKKLKALVG